MYKYQDYNNTSPSYMYCMLGTGFYSHVEWRFRPIEIVKHIKLPVPSQESEWSCIYVLEVLSGISMIFGLDFGTVQLF